GGTVAFEGSIPPFRPGLEGMDAPRRSIEDVRDELDRNARDRLVVGDDPTAVARRAGVEPEPMAPGLQFVRRATSDGHIYFIKNTGDREFSGWVPLAVPARSAALYDPLSGRTGLAASRARGREGRLDVYLRLASGETRLLRTSEDHSLQRERWTYMRPDGEPVRLEGRWHVSFIDGGPALPDDIRTDELASWTELGGRKAKSFAGTARYELTFRMPEKDTEHWLLDLGRVCHSSRVTLNGKDLGTLITPPFRTRAGDALREGENRLVVEVTNLAANRVRHLDRQGVDWKNFYNIGFASMDYGRFDPSGWDIMESGLLGPVRLRPREAFEALPQSAPMSKANM
ncbi:MAG: glycosylhydrolase-like jelly roll fold domain-containing protein, partial [Planctomycetota bacterium]